MFRSGYNFELLIQKLTILQESLRKGLWHPEATIAVLGLNPHAGEKGLLGTEDIGLSGRP